MSGPCPVIQDFSHSMGPLLLPTKSVFPAANHYTTFLSVQTCECLFVLPLLLQLKLVDVSRLLVYNEILPYV